MEETYICRYKFKGCAWSRSEAFKTCEEAMAFREGLKALNNFLVQDAKRLEGTEIAMSVMKWEVVEGV